MSLTPKVSSSFAMKQVNTVASIPAEPSKLADRLLVSTIITSRFEDEHD